MGCNNYSDYRSVLALDLQCFSDGRVPHAGAATINKNIVTHELFCVVREASLLPLVSVTITDSYEVALIEQFHQNLIIDKDSKFMPLLRESLNELNSGWLKRLELSGDIRLESVL